MHTFRRAAPGAGWGPPAAACALCWALTPPALATGPVAGEATSPEPIEPKEQPEAPKVQERTPDTVPSVPSPVEGADAPRDVGASSTRGDTEPPAPQPTPAEDLLAPSTASAPPPRPGGAVAPRPEPTVHRPAWIPGDPPRFNAVIRGMFANVGLHKDDGPGGRLGGVRADFGVTWNYIGAAVTVSAWGGRVTLGNEVQTPALLGGGPTLGLGRLALLSRGVLDLRLGYDFYWAPARTGAGARQPMAPHGPRISLDLGILGAGGGQAQWWHAFGATLGYQILVHDLAGTLGPTSLLSVGLLYWLG